MRYVGDREITLYPSGDWWTKGRPFMDVKVIRGSFWDERVTRIIYKTVDNWESKFNLYMPSGLFYLSSLDRSIFNIKDICLVLLITMFNIISCI